MPLHLVAWGTALGLYFIFFHRLARILALDLEALVYNEAEGLVARVDRGELATDALLLQYAALPLVVVVTARLVYALARWLRGTADPVGALPLWARLPIFAAALAGFFFFSEPCSRALAVWLSVEAFWWIQWSGKVQPAMEWIFLHAALPARGLLVASAALALWLALRRGEEPQRVMGDSRAPRPWWPLRLLRWGVAVAALLLLVGLAVVLGVHGSRVAVAPGLGVFSKTCGGCHIRSRPLFFIKTPSEWRTTITRMRKLEKAPLTEQQAEDVIAFVSGMRSFDDQWTFSARCQRCHGAGSLLWEDRPVADWERITRRLARYSPYYYKAPVRRQLVAHLKKSHGDEQATLGLSADRYRAVMALGDACETCHGITRGASRARRLDEQGVLSLLRRMNAKRPKPWTERRLRALVPLYRELVADAETLERLFPHQAPAEGGLPW